jgi:GAF domain-containing protein
MPKVTTLPHARTLTLPLARGASVQLTPFRGSPQVAVALVGPHGGDAGGMILGAGSARLLGTWLVRLADGSLAQLGAAADPPAEPTEEAVGRLPDPAADLDAALLSFARLAVPVFADWCSIDVADEAARPIRRLAIVCADTSKRSAARVLAGYPHDPELPHPRSEVWRTGQPEVAPDVGAARLASAARSEEHLAVLRAVACKSSLAVPIMDRARVLGVMTFAFAESSRRYGERDVPFALTLARCAGIAAANARAYGEARQALRERPAAATAGRRPGRSAGR